MKSEKKHEKKILLIAPHPRSRGGVVSVVQAIYKMQQNGKFRFQWLTTQDDRNIAVKLFSLFFAWILAPWQMCRADLIHIHTASYNSFRRKTLFVLWAVLLHKKYILHIHGGGFSVFLQNSSPLMRRLYVFVMRQAAALVTLGKQFDQTVEKYLPDNSPPRCIIPNPGRFPLQEPCERSNDTVSVLYCGWLEPEKGVFDLIKAFAVCAQENWRLIMVGKGPHEALLAAAGEAGIAGQLELRGWQNEEELSELYRSSTLLVLPSYTEGMPMVLLEAMAFGLPLISTPVGGIPDMLPTGAENFLHTPGDTAALSDLMSRMIADCRMRREWGENLRQHFAEHFTETRVFNKISTLYNQLLEKDLHHGRFLA